MEEITRMCDSMSLTAKEGGRVYLSDSQEVLGGLLAAKFLTKRVVNLEAVMRTLKPLWRAAHGLKGRDMGNNRVMFLFTDNTDMERVLANGPWTFDKYLILLKRIEDDQSFSQVVFDSCSFWVQIHDLPVRCMNSGVCGKIGNTLGRVEQVEEFTVGRGGGNYLRVRVQMDVTQPLCRGRKIWLGGDQDHWVSFKFERLPIFCYWCGHITHDDKDCSIWLNSRGQLSPDKQEYGPWLRGELPRFPRREWSGRGAPSRDFSSSEDKGDKMPAQSSGVAVQNNPKMDKPKITNNPNVVTETIDFQEKLKEIDRELGLEHGEINENMELLMQSDSLAKFQIHKEGEPCSECNKAGLVEGELIGPQLHGPVVEMNGHQKLGRKPTGSTWKRIVRPNMEAFDEAQQTGKTQQKRSQNALPEEEIVRNVKKTKAVGYPSNTSMVEISVEVAMQPRWTP